MLEIISENVCTDVVGEKRIMERENDDIQSSNSRCGKDFYKG